MCCCLCCVLLLWEVSPTQHEDGAGLDVGQPSPILAGASGEPMLHVPVGWGALGVFTTTQHNLSSCKYKSDLTCYHPAGEYHQSRWT